MKKLMQRLQENRKNNKGFTLVELIIVIAIIAVLSAVLAPQYIRYVEKSREATDYNAINEVINAVKVAAADPANTSAKTGIINVAVNDTSHKLTLTEGTGTGATGPTGLVDAVSGVNGLVSLPTMQSADGRDLSFTITVALTGNGVTFDEAELADLKS